MIGVRAQILRVALGLGLPVLMALPVWWGLRAESHALRESQALIEAELEPLAEAEALGTQNAELRVAVIERITILAALEEDRGLPLIWLGALGDLPPAMALTRAELSGAEWVVEGFATSPETLELAHDGLARAGLAPAQVEPLDATLPGVPFRMRGRVASGAEARAP